MERSDEDIIKRVKLIRDSIYGVGEQLMNDFKVILEEYRNNSMVFDGLSEGLVRKISFSNEKEKMLLCSEHGYLPRLMKLRASSFFESFYGSFLCQFLCHFSFTLQNKFWKKKRKM